MNYLAPSGTPIGIKLLMKWFLSILRQSNVLNDFADKIKQRYNVKHCLFLSSGRTALYLLLECLFKLKNDPEKNQVIIPSYTCFSVPGSIEKAGLLTRVCDIDPETLSYDLEQLKEYDFSKVLAIVTSNLYGIPNDLPAIEKIARQNGVYLIDDAAQCLDGKVDGKYSGTFGDVGLFSLDKGKNITSIQGGIIVTNSDQIAESMSSVISALPRQSALHVLTDCLKLLIYSILLPPSRYWLVTKLPFLGLGLTPYTTDYPVHQYSRIMGTMAYMLFEELHQITQQRIENGSLLKQGLQGVPGVRGISYREGIRPVCLRLPLLIENSEKRSALLEALHNAGIGATASYPSAIVDIEQIRNKLSVDDKYAIIGRKIAQQIITLPTHHYTNSEHISKILKIFRDTSG